MNTPTPTDLARILGQLSERLYDEGEKAMRRAPVLAARGWPVSTNGSEGGRSSDPTSSTERAALNPGMFDDIDGRLREHMRLCHYMAVKIHANLDVIMAHAPDDDEIPPGTGSCLVEGCDHICNPRKNPNDRLRGGLCPKHHKRLMRMDPRPSRDWYIRYAEAQDVA